MSKTDAAIALCKQASDLLRKALEQLDDHEFKSEVEEAIKSVPESSTAIKHYILLSRLLIQSLDHIDLNGETYEQIWEFIQEGGY